jgi:hypothetical protein
MVTGLVVVPVASVISMVPLELVASVQPSYASVVLAALKVAPVVTSPVGVEHAPDALVQYANVMPLVVVAPSRVKSKVCWTPVAPGSLDDSVRLMLVRLPAWATVTAQAIRPNKSSPATKMRFLRGIETIEDMGSFLLRSYSPELRPRFVLLHIST